MRVSSGGGAATPSYDQVAQPLYTHARYRWQNYAEALAPVEAQLQRYIAAFGYG